MSKGISSYPVKDRKKVVERRLKNKTGGLGYLGALDYKSKVKDPTEE